MAECLLKVTLSVSLEVRLTLAVRGCQCTAQVICSEIHATPGPASDIIHPDYCWFSTGGMISLTFKQAYFCGMLFVAYFYFSCINEGVVVGILLKLLGYH